MHPNKGSTLNTITSTLGLQENVETNHQGYKNVVLIIYRDFSSQLEKLCDLICSVLRIERLWYDKTNEQIRQSSTNVVTARTLFDDFKVYDDRTTKWIFSRESFQDMWRSNGLNKNKEPAKSISDSINQSTGTYDFNKFEESLHSIAVQQGKSLEYLLRELSAKKPDGRCFSDLKMGYLIPLIYDESTEIPVRTRKMTGPMVGMDATAVSVGSSSQDVRARLSSSWSSSSSSSQGIVAMPRAPVLLSSPRAPVLPSSSLDQIISYDMVPEAVNKIETQLLDYFESGIWCRNRQR